MTTAWIVLTIVSYLAILRLTFVTGRRQVALKVVEKLIEIGKRDLSLPNELLVVYVELPKMLDDEFNDWFSRWIADVVRRREDRKAVAKLTGTH